ncbi:hypothetical protein [Acetobacter pasteurianus]|uniref:hypothetical protein n=1 Tax=Acetobacter pasteurianus TaxID=438 RepID=UPI000B3EDDDA|nr:hypothetical protein [Acetobacter pasteurianus]
MRESANMRKNFESSHTAIITANTGHFWGVLLALEYIPHISRLEIIFYIFYTKVPENRHFLPLLYYSEIADWLDFSAYSPEKPAYKRSNMRKWFLPEKAEKAERAANMLANMRKFRTFNSLLCCVCFAAVVMAVVIAAADGRSGDGWHLHHGSYIYQQTSSSKAD